MFTFKLVLTGLMVLVTGENQMTVFLLNGMGGATDVVHEPYLEFLCEDLKTEITGGPPCEEMFEEVIDRHQFSLKGGYYLRLIPPLKVSPPKLDLGDLTLLPDLEKIAGKQGIVSQEFLAPKIPVGVRDRVKGRLVINHGTVRTVAHGSYEDLKWRFKKSDGNTHEQKVASNVEVVMDVPTGETVDLEFTPFEYDKDDQDSPQPFTLEFGGGGEVRVDIVNEPSNLVEYCLAQWGKKHVEHFKVLYRLSSEDAAGAPIPYAKGFKKALKKECRDYYHDLLHPDEERGKYPAICMTSRMGK